MDKLETSKIVQKVLTDYAAIPYAYGDIKCYPIISEGANHYLLVTMGWEDDVRVHGCVVHLEMVGDKIWIHRDGTEDGMATELAAAGIPKEQIVLAFHPPELRQYTEYAAS